MIFFCDILKYKYFFFSLEIDIELDVFSLRKKVMELQTKLSKNNQTEGEYPDMRIRSIFPRVPGPLIENAIEYVHSQS